MKKILNIASGLLTLALLVSVSTFAYIISFYGSVATQPRDCAVVFGAAVWPGGNPSHALSDRTHAAIDLYNREVVSCLVFSGADSAYDKHEVDVMTDIAFEREVTLEDVELDYEGHNTQKTINSLDASRSYVLVSNDFHLARINLLATQRGDLTFDLHASEYQKGRYSREPFFLLREVAAFWYYALGG